MEKMRKIRKRIAKLLTMALVVAGNICYVPQMAESVCATGIWLWVKDNPANFECSLFGETVSFTPASGNNPNTLTLSSCNLTFEGLEDINEKGVIYYSGTAPLKIVLYGDNTLTATGDKGLAGIYSKGDLIFEGPGSLTVNGGAGINGNKGADGDGCAGSDGEIGGKGGFGISSAGGVTINSGSLAIKGGNGGSGGSGGKGCTDPNLNCNMGGSGGKGGNGGDGLYGNLILKGGTVQIYGGDGGDGGNGGESDILFYIDGGTGGDGGSGINGTLRFTDGSIDSIGGSGGTGGKHFQRGALTDKKNTSGKNGAGAGSTISTVSPYGIRESDDNTNWTRLSNGSTSTKKYLKSVKLIPLTVTVKDQIHIYNGYQQGEGDPIYNDPDVIKEKITVEGQLKSGHRVGSIQLNGQGTDIGEYVININYIHIKDASDNLADDDYYITLVPGKLIITKGIYTVTFTDGLGNVLKTEKVADSKAATAPAAPTRAGYDFTGWDKDFTKVTSNMTVTAKWKKKQQPAAKVTGITLTSPKSTLECGETMNLTAVVKPDNASNKKLIWTSSNTKAATVSGSGLVTAKKGGKTIITAMAADGSRVKASVNIRVKEYKDIKRVYISPMSVNLKAGKTKIVKAIILPADARNMRVSWKSSRPGVASVVAISVKKAKITANKTGTAKITVTTADGRKKKTIKVMVKK
ncbi:MAG: Ig domain-containing protein [Lachnospiraceae bacterium]|nr:Ig domain-containing protein [Lachnospiraceae bacterium]